MEPRLSAGLSGFRWLRLPVDLPGFNQHSWSSEFLQPLIGIFFSGVEICLTDRIVRRFLVYIGDFVAPAFTYYIFLRERSFYKLLGFKKFASPGEGLEVASTNYAHGVPPVNARGRRLRHPKILNVFYFLRVSL